MEKIKTVLKDYYELDRMNVSQQQGGWAALAYKVFDDDETYFLKVYEKSRVSTPKWTALIDHYVPVLRWLEQNSGLKGKIPVPLMTKHGEYKCENEDAIYLLYQYIEGETIGNRVLTKEQVCELAEIISELHSYGEELPVVSEAIREDFDVPFIQQLRDVLEKDFNGLSAYIKEVITPHILQIEELVDTVESLSMKLKNGHLRMALCHTDIHNWNLMQSGPQLMLIDWEGLKLAPVEADLMFLGNHRYFEDLLQTYRKVHKDYELSPEVLQFYQGRRKMEDIWEFVEQLIFDEQNDQERAETVRYLLEELKELSQ